MLIDYTTQSSAQRYALMSQSIIPRPIAWIVTESREGILNIAPFSYFTGLSSQPPTVIVSIGHKSDGTPKDTLRNIRQTGRCTICMVEESALERMHFSSKSLEAERSEAEVFDIPTERIVPLYPSIVSGTPTALFCSLYHEIDLTGSKTIPIILEIASQYIDESAVEIQEERYTLTFRPVARVGRSYALLGEEITPPKMPD